VSARRERLRWWLPSKHWRNDGWRWRVATLVDKLPGQCWASLVDWTLRSHEDDPDTPWEDFKRRMPIRSIGEGCRSDGDRVGTCYCGKLRTAEADAAMRANGAGRGVVR
jgi:hypothetical protein